MRQGGDRWALLMGLSWASPYLASKMRDGHCAPWSVLGPPWNPRGALLGPFGPPLPHSYVELFWVGLVGPNLGPSAEKNKNI